MKEMYGLLEIFWDYRNTFYVHAMRAYEHGRVNWTSENQSVPNMPLKIFIDLRVHLWQGNLAALNDRGEIHLRGSFVIVFFELDFKRFGGVATFMIYVAQEINANWNAFN